MFGRKELKDLGIAALVLGIAFAWILRVGLSLPIRFLISLVTVGSAFIFHELSHKFVAERLGGIARFEKWDFGLILALFFSIVFRFVFAAPGAVRIYLGPTTLRENAMIAVAGPITNIGLAAVFAPIMLLGGFLGTLGYVGFIINVFLAAFNLLPIPPLDGNKVFRWNRKVWVAIVIPLFSILFFV